MGFFSKPHAYYGCLQNVSCRLWVASAIFALKCNRNLQTFQKTKKYFNTANESKASVTPVSLLVSYEFLVTLYDVTCLFKKLLHEIPSDHCPKKKSDFNTDISFCVQNKLI